MKNLTRLLALLAALMLCLVPVLSGLAETADETAAETTEEAAAETTEETAEEDAVAYPVTGDPSDVLATVNGEAITRAEVNELYDYIYEMYSYYGAYYGIDVTDPETQQQMYAMAAQYTVSYKIEEQKEAEMGFDQLTDEELAELEEETDENWEGYIESYITYYGGGLADDATDEEKLAARTNAVAGLEAMGYTYDSMLESAKSNAAYEKLYAEVVKDVTVTDEEVEAAFEEQVAEDAQTYADAATYEVYTQYYGYDSYYVPEGYRGIIHILLNVDDDLLSTYQDLEARLEEQEAAASEESTETAETTESDEETEPVTQEQVDAARDAILASLQTTIDDIYARLDAGESFESLIAEYGNDPGMETEPYASEGYSVSQDSVMFDPVFVQAAFSVDNVGDVSEPYIGSYGVHIIKYLRDVPAGAVELTDDIKATVRETLLSTAESEAYEAATNAWLEESEVVYDLEIATMIEALNAAMAE